MDWQKKYKSKEASLPGVVELIPKGKHIFIGSGAAEPVGLVEALGKRAQHFADNPVVHLLTLGPAPYVEHRLEDYFRHNAFFIGPNVREAVYEGRADYTPVFLSQIPRLIRTRRIGVDAALIQTTPPDSFGFVNLGVSIDVVLAAIEAASLVIAEINPNMPVVYGSGFIPMDRIDAWVHHPSKLPTLDREAPDDVALEIGRNVASLVEAGATLQIGIGQVPDATLKALESKKDLGVWTEMLPDGVIDLIENGNITGKHKTIEPRKISASFTFGTQKTYDFINRNPAFMFHPSDYINDPVLVSQQHKMVAINGALQIDLTGQVCADSIGTRFYSGIGGQVDFIRGASMCPGGKPIIAMRSTAKQKSVSKIVATLDEGAGVVTSRGDVAYVVTEYGVADLEGKSIRERALSLISIAHPDYRADLLSAAKNRHYVFPDQIEPPRVPPRAYEKEVAIGGHGSVRFRPIRVTDEQKMSDLFYSFSDETVYRRWMTAVPRMSHRNLLDYLKTDESKNVAIVAETTKPDAESELIGVGRYHTDRATNYAEVALVIRDNYQGRGIGSALFAHMLKIAKNGLEGFTAEVLGTNRAMLQVFHKSGLSLQSTLSAGVYSVTMPFQHERAPAASDDSRELRKSP